MSDCPDLSIPRLREAYARGTRSPRAVVQSIYAHIARLGDDRAWIRLLPQVAVLERATALEADGPSAAQPLWGIPFAVKDNIDVAGLPTTAGCPAFAHTPERTATVVQRLLDAGAILIGKTNLDQFATGLVGTRSPYGAPSSVFSAGHVSGGSSSGSAVAVASGYASFALGTDTAGSGRVPAAFNNIVGAKPTRGWLPNTGVVPACRSLDCVSVFALSAGESWEVLRLIGGADGEDAGTRAPIPQGLPSRPRIGVLREDQREFFGDTEAAAAYAHTLQQLATLGDLVEFDFTPFHETAALLYDGPWVAERLEATAALLRSQPTALDATVATVVEQGRQYSALDAHLGYARLAVLRQRTAATWQQVDVLALPTAGTHYRIDEVIADPLRLNTNLGRYTNFANLLDLAAIAVPAGFRTDGLPFGITFFAPAWTDAALATLATRAHALAEVTAGATDHVVAPSLPRLDWQAQPGEVRLAVVGAHLTGMPLNRELTERAARFVCETRTAPHYRLYALPGTVPPKPGMQRVVDGGGSLIVEVWAMSRQAYGDFVSRIPAPLGIGTLTLESGETVQGFLCEAHALQGARDITEFGGWRAFVANEAAKQAR